MDVNPLSLGIEVKSGEMSVIIPRNTPIRSTVRMTDTFVTTVDNQESVIIRIYEGERIMPENNHLLGEFELDGILPAPKGEGKIEVTFQIDPSGILVVTADDLGRKKGQGSVTKTITNKHNRLSQEQIKKLILEAQKYAKADKIKTQKLNARNELESYVWNLKSLIANEAEDEFGGLLHPEEKDQLNSMIQEILQWFDENPKAGHLDSKRQLMKIETLVDRIIGRINASTGRLFIVNSTKVFGHDEL
jgi:heat shock protein 5